MELQLLHITVRDDLPAPVDARAYAADPLRAHSGLAGQGAQAGVRVVLFCSDTAGQTVAVHVTGWEPRTRQTASACQRRALGGSRAGMVGRSLGRGRRPRPSCNGKRHRQEAL